MSLESDEEIYSDEYMYLGVPSELIGKKTTISELEKIFKEKISLVDDRNFQVFGIKDGFPNYVAYKCNSCEELVAGPPREDYFSSPIEGLAGGNGFHYQCRNCDEYLGTRRIRQS